MMVPQSVLAWAIAFALAHTDYHPPGAGVLPEIDEVDFGRVGTDGQVDPITGKMTIDASWEDTKKNRSILLHEIVHWLQWRDGKMWTTPACKIEREAYIVEVEYLHEEHLAANLSPASIMSMDCFIPGNSVSPAELMMRYRIQNYGDSR